MNILKELYYGNLCPSERCFSPNSSYDTALEILNENETELNEVLSDEDRKRLRRLLDAQAELLNITALESFLDGYRLGARFLLDTFVAEGQRALHPVP